MTFMDIFGRFYAELSEKTFSFHSTRFYFFQLFLTRKAVYPSCRLSLTAKASSSLVWSLASEVHFVNWKAGLYYPFTNVFQHTSNYLTEVSLRNPVEVQEILPHLEKHCPRLQKLSVHENLFLDWAPRMFDCFTAILSRLMSFVIWSERRDKAKHYEAGKDERGRKLLLDIFDFIGSPILLEDLKICFHYETDVQVFQFAERVVGKLRTLRNLEAYIPHKMAHLIVLKVGPEFESLGLKHSECQRSLNEDEFDVKGYLRQFYDRPIPINLYFCKNASDESVNVFSFCSYYFRRADVVDVLCDLGLKRKISLADLEILIALVSKERDPDLFFQLVEQILSSKYPFLPTRDEVVRQAQHLLGSTAYMLRPESIRLFLNAFGHVRPNPFQLMPPVFQHFDADLADTLVQLNIVDSAALVSSNDKDENLFSFVKTAEVFDWLVRQMPQCDAMRLLRQPDNGGVCPAARIIRHYSVLDRIRELSPSLLAFPDVSFVDAAYSCLVNGVDDLKAIVECTGPKNICSEALGRVLALCWKWDYCETGSTVEYWLQVLDSLGERSNLDFFHRDVYGSIYGSHNRAQLVHVSRKFAPLLIRQARERNAEDVLSVLTELTQWIYFSSKTKDAKLTRSDVATVVRDMFDPLADMFLQRPDLRTTDVVVPAADQERSWLSYRLHTVSEIMRVYLTYEFDDRQDDICLVYHVLTTFSKIVVRLIGFKSSCGTRLVQGFLPGIGSSTMNLVPPGSTLSLMDEILLEKNAHKFHDHVTLIETLVARGCRISDPDLSNPYCQQLANKTALAAYFNAVSKDRTRRIFQQ